MRLRFLSLLLLGSLLTMSAPAAADFVTVHVVPFGEGPVAPTLAEALFDGFVDQLDLAGARQGVGVEIIKVPLPEVDAAWLAQHTWVSGAITAYAEDIGCCSTEFQVRARIETHPAGSDRVVAVELEDEAFFDHDLATLAAEQLLVGDRLGRTLADHWLEAQAKH